jgi:hypothetical protein
VEEVIRLRRARVGAAKEKDEARVSEEPARG